VKAPWNTFLLIFFLLTTQLLVSCAPRADLTAMQDRRPPATQLETTLPSFVPADANHLLGQDRMQMLKAHRSSACARIRFELERDSPTNWHVFRDHLGCPFWLGHATCSGILSEMLVQLHLPSRLRSRYRASRRVDPCSERRSPSCPSRTQSLSPRSAPSALLSQARIRSKAYPNGV